VNGVENGWAADVEVAGGGSEELARTELREKVRAEVRLAERRLRR